MRPLHSRFNHIAFSELIETKLGFGGIKEISVAIKVTPKTINQWMSGRTKSGPSLKAWDQLKVYFAKRDIKINREEFYREERADDNQHIAEPIGKPYSGKKKADTKKIVALFSSLEESVDNTNYIFGQLKKEIEKLKK